MSREEIEQAQMPTAGWTTETRAFAQNGVDSPPKWSDFDDPLDAISARFKAGIIRASNRLPAHEVSALKTLGLDELADRNAIRTSYAELVRKYHPDRNGGDRRFEKKLQNVVDAYQVLRDSPAFAK
jgi:DnaJ-domain-containing protein 1